MAVECIYADEKYSEGSVLVVDDREYVCVETFGYGAWAEHSSEKSAANGSRRGKAGTDKVLTVKAKGKQPADCFYAGKRYSHGAPLVMPNGKPYRCIEGKREPNPKPDPPK